MSESAVSIDDATRLLEGIQTLRVLGGGGGKVDTHVHHSACMHQKHLLRFIKSKLRKEPDEVVIFRDGKYLTLKEVFESLNMTGCLPRFDPPFLVALEEASLALCTTYQVSPSGTRFPLQLGALFSYYRGLSFFS